MSKRKEKKRSVIKIGGFELAGNEKRKKKTCAVMRSEE